MRWLFAFAFSAFLLAIAHGWTEDKVLSVAGGVWSLDVGETEFNARFWASGGVIRRSCSSCGTAHQEIYYKRLTYLKSFEAYSYFRTSWFSDNNLLGTDFELYSTLADLEAGANEWAFCNYNDDNIGPFRDCGPTVYVPFEWVSNGRGGDTADFYILTDCVDAECSDGDICNGEESCIDGQCASPNDFECPADFLCSTGQQRCVRDCTTFAVDGYLRDCSEEFDTIKNDIVDNTDKAYDNAEDIAALQPTVQANADGLADVSANVDDINGVIGGDRANWAGSETILDQLAVLNERMNDVDSLLLRMTSAEARLDAAESRLSSFSPQADQGENSDNSFTAPDEQEEQQEEASVLSVPFPYLVAIIAFLMLLNIGLLVNNFCCQESGGRKQYQVYRDSSADEHQHLERVRN